MYVRNLTYIFDFSGHGSDPRGFPGNFWVPGIFLKTNIKRTIFFDRFYSTYICIKYARTNDICITKYSTPLKI